MNIDERHRMSDKPRTLSPGELSFMIESLKEGIYTIYRNSQIPAPVASMAIKEVVRDIEMESRMHHQQFVQQLQEQEKQKQEQPKIYKAPGPRPVENVEELGLEEMPDTAPSEPELEPEADEAEQTGNTNTP